MRLISNLYLTFTKSVLALFIVMSYPLMAKEIGEWKPVTLDNTLSINFYSEITKKTYTIYIAVPTTPPHDSKKGYPVAFLLDGYVSFVYAEKAATRLISRQVIDPVIIVSIDFAKEGNNAPRTLLRTHDYTPTIYEDYYFKNNKTYSGGANDFLAFIQKELKPFLAKKFAINKNHQALYGHSYGGLFVLHTLAVAPSSFQYYYAASPSIWWDNRYILNELKHYVENTTINTQKTPPIIVRASVGALEQKPDGNNVERVKIIKERAQVDNLIMLASLLNNVPKNTLDFSYQIIPNEDHGSVQAVAINRFISGFAKKHTLK